MKLKRNSLLVLFLGFTVSFIGFIMPLIYWKSYISNNGAIGIIGGADAPTYTFMLSALFDGLPFVLVILGIILVVSSVFCLLFPNVIKKHCNINTSIISLGLSILGALGLVCAFLWFSIVSFGEMSKRPIEYHVSVLIGIISFFGFIFLIALYLKTRKKNWSIKGIVIDVFTSIVYLLAFFFIFSYLYGLVA